jgi:hypothetical protein
MPVYRTPDGKIVEEKTQISRPSSPSSEAPTTLDPDTVQPTEQEGSRYDAKTVVAGSGSGSAAPVQPPAAPEASSANDNRTRLVGAGVKQDVEEPAPGGVDDPVTGWLVVIEGPGRGACVSIGVGRNSIGRAASDRITLDFGDDTISREAHLVIVYDHRGRKFWVQSGQSQNLSYLDGNPILETTPLSSGADLQLGDTHLRFVAFCGEDFDWSEG